MKNQTDRQIDSIRKVQYSKKPLSHSMSALSAKLSTMSWVSDTIKANPLTHRLLLWALSSVDAGTTEALYAALRRQHCSTLLSPKREQAQVWVSVSERVQISSVDLNFHIFGCWKFYGPSERSSSLTPQKISHREERYTIYWAGISACTGTGCILFPAAFIVWFSGTPALVLSLPQPP